MANKNRSIYNVDEDVLKRMVAGDTSALEKIKEQKEQLVEEGKDTKAAEQPEKKKRSLLRIRNRLPRRKQHPLSLMRNTKSYS